MNRRQFTQGLGALAAAPALPVKAIAGTAAAPGIIPNTARFWAIYMSHLHGVCTPQALATATGISQTAAQGYLTSMIADGVITPTRIVSQAILGKATTGTPTSSQSPKSISERLKKFLTETDDTEMVKPQDTPEEAQPQDQDQETS